MSHSFQDMLGAVFAAQDETFEGEIIPLAQWRDIVAGRAPLDEAAASALLASPLNRRLYDKAYHAEREALFASAANLVHAPRLRQAASPSGLQPFHIDGLTGVHIAIRPLGGGGWHIAVDVSELSLPVGAELTVRDNKGRVWFAGNTLRDPVLFQRWLLEETPQEVVADTSAIGLFLDGLPLVPMTDLTGGQGDG